MVATKTVATSPFEGQKPGTSGLRKKTKVFQQEHYVENFVQCSLNAAGLDALRGKTLVVGGDGRFYNDVMVQKIVKICCANGVGKVVTGQNGLLSTPAVSALIREIKAEGGFILTASHNPGGPENDCGIKYNVSNGGPAPEKITNAIFANTKTIKEYFTCEFDDIDLANNGTTQVSDSFSVQVVDPTEVYCQLMRSVFDFMEIKSLLNRTDFTFCYDAMHGVAGPYAKRIFCTELGVSEDALLNCVPSPDFNGGHPDPNLVYAHELVEKMGLKSDGSKVGDGQGVPDFGAAADGDADRNMILGRQFFVTPSDSLAVIAANADAIPFFRDAGGLKSVARSMPTSAAADLVGKKKGLDLFQVPTGWKFFGNLMDSADLYGKTDYNPLICGEESFGTGSNHIREKDGIWAVLAWLQILASKNGDATKPLVTVQQIVETHWAAYGRSYYCRYDYEEVESEKAAAMMAGLTDEIKKFNEGGKQPKPLSEKYSLVECDQFEYHDPVDGSISSNQGWRFIFQDGSRFVFRLSGTGSSGATIRLYIEKFDQRDTDRATADALKEIVDIALQVSDLELHTGRKKPTVIT